VRIYELFIDRIRLFVPDSLFVDSANKKPGFPGVMRERNIPFRFHPMYVPDNRWGFEWDESLKVSRVSKNTRERLERFKLLFL